MFVFDPDYTFDWPVKVVLPSDGGVDIVQEFDATFTMPDDEKAFFSPVEGETQTDRLDAARARLAQHLVGWKGIKVKGGEDLPYSETTKDRLLANRHIRIAVDKALFDAVIGIREKN